MTSQWPRTHGEAAAGLDGRLPGTSRARLVPIGEGDHCFAFRQHSRVVRVAKHEEAAAALAREACVMPAIAGRLPLAVPEPRFVRADEHRAFSVHAHLRGASLTRARWERLAPEPQEATASDLGRFLSALHALPLDIGASCGLPTLDRATFAAGLLPAFAPLQSALAPTVARRLEAALTTWAEPTGSPAPCLLHGDIAPGHVLFDPKLGRLTGVIDFGDLAVGDPARDLIYVWEDFGPFMLEAVLRHYRHEPAGSLLPRIHMWFVLETVAWCVAQAESQRATAVRRHLSGIVSLLP
jgi:aminoglycoside phosphotransferase (APT) family kinase protein